MAQKVNWIINISTLPTALYVCRPMTIQTKLTLVKEDSQTMLEVQVHTEPYNNCVGSKSKCLTIPAMNCETLTAEWFRAVTVVFMGKIFAIKLKAIQLQMIHEIKSAATFCQSLFKKATNYRLGHA